MSSHFSGTLSPNPCKGHYPLTLLRFALTKYSRHIKGSILPDTPLNYTAKQFSRALRPKKTDSNHREAKSMPPQAAYF